MRVSDYFGLNKSQSELDFVDVPADGDLPLFVDPFALSIETANWVTDCSNAVKSYFQAVLETIRTRDRLAALRLLSHLGEPNDVHLGYSSGAPAGRGVGLIQSRALYDRLRLSRAMRTGQLQDLEDAELMIDGVGPDKISDITVNLIRANLIEYTQDQSALHNITTHNVPIGPLWVTNNQRWESKYVKLPILSGKPLVLIPKALVRRQALISHHDFYQNQITDYLVAENIEAGSSLVQHLKDGRPWVAKKDVRAQHRKSKRYVSEFNEEHPEQLERYKEIKASLDQPMSNLDVELGREDARELADVGTLVEELRNIPTGSGSATEYHRAAVDILEVLFYPQLSNPRIEREINDGRKRLDFTFSPMFQSRGFFTSLGPTYNIHCPIVQGEAKNYTHDIGNDALDQLIGRFSQHRGRFGILIVRNIDDPRTLLARCKDAVLHGQGHIIVLTDDDLYALANTHTEYGEQGINQFMQRKLEELLL